MFCTHDWVLAALQYKKQQANERLYGFPRGLIANTGLTVDADICVGYEIDDWFLGIWERVIHVL
jgi:hypothetical protein